MTSAGVTVLVLIGVLLIVGPIALFARPRLVAPLVHPIVAAPIDPYVVPHLDETLERSGKDVIVTLTFKNPSANSGHLPLLH